MSVPSTASGGRGRRRLSSNSDASSTGWLNGTTRTPRLLTRSISTSRKTTRMTRAEKYHAVLLHGVRAGTLHQFGDHTRFLFSERYLDYPDRPVLGLRLERRLRTQ